MVLETERSILLENCIGCTAVPRGMGGNVQKWTGTFFTPTDFSVHSWRPDQEKKRNSKIDLLSLKSMRAHSWRTFFKLSVYGQCFGLYLLLRLPCNMDIVVTPVWFFFPLSLCCENRMLHVGGGMQTAVTSCFRAGVPVEQGGCSFGNQLSCRVDYCNENFFSVSSHLLVQSEGLYFGILNFFFTKGGWWESWPLRCWDSGSSTFTAFPDFFFPLTL